jgi:hypothetical protein
VAEDQSRDHFLSASGGPADGPPSWRPSVTVTSQRTLLELIYQAQRTGIFRRLVDADRVNELEAEHLITRWERVCRQAWLKPAHPFTPQAAVARCIPTAFRTAALEASRWSGAYSTLRRRGHHGRKGRNP